MHNQHLPLLWLLEQSHPPFCALPPHPQSGSSRPTLALSPLPSPILWSVPEAVPMVLITPVHGLEVAASSRMPSLTASSGTYSISVKLL